MKLLIVGSIALILTGLFLIIWLQRDTTTLATPTAATGKQDNFVGEVRSVLQEFFPEIVFSYNSDTDTFSPAEENADGPITFLGNLRNRTQDMSQIARIDFLRNFFGHLTQETDLTPEILRKNLLIRNRTPEEFSLRQISFTPHNDDEPFEPIIFAKGDMLFEPVLDLDNAVQPMNVKTMREHGFAFGEFVQVAKENLLRLTPVNSDDQWELIAENIWISKIGDDYDAARLFLFPEHLALPVQGALIAYAPSHAVCLITTHTDPETLQQMIELGNQSAETHRQLSLALWKQTDTGWSRLQSDDRNSVEGRAALIENLTAYNDQQSVLEQYFEKTKQDIHVAKIIARVNETIKGNPVIETRSVFIGQGSYLPKTDIIVLGYEQRPQNDTMLEIEWDKFIAIIGEENLPAHPDYTPTRYMYSNLLSQDRIEALRAAAVEL